MENTSQELPSSVLGTLDYWETTYTTEIKNFDDHEDIGEVWFGGANSANVVRYISGPRLNLSKELDKIIDLGCGNGWACVQLAKAGFKKITGIDYSSKAIELAKKIAIEENVSNIEYLTCDFVDGNERRENFKFKLAHDKGTYDAVGLSPDNPKEKRQKYIEHVHLILDEGGFFVIVSCNWTKDELIEHFRDHFVFFEQIPTKSFSFGGKTGNTITILVFVKKNNS